MVALCWRGAEIPVSALVGGIGTFAAGCSVVALHGEARTIGVPWMLVGLAGYFLYRRRHGLNPRAQYRLERAQRPADFRVLGYRTALLPIFGQDVSAATLASAAKLIGADGVVYAVFVLPIPAQLPLDAGLVEEEAYGRVILESARIQGRRAGIKVRAGLIRTRNPGRALVDEAERIGADVVYLSTRHAPSSEQRIGATAAYLLAKRPCRVIIETEGGGVPAPATTRH